MKPNSDNENDSIFKRFYFGVSGRYSSYETEIVVMENNALAASSNYKFSAAVWLPFVFKQIPDDSYAHKNYILDSRSSVVGIEIGKLIRSLPSVK